MRQLTGRTGDGPAAGARGREGAGRGGYSPGRRRKLHWRRKRRCGESRNLRPKIAASKISRLRRQMDTAVSAAQITALEHEIGFAENAIAKLEEEELNSLERTDALELQRAEAVGLLTAADSALEDERRRAAELTERNRAEIAKLEGERAELRAGIAARAEIAENMLATYDRVARSRGTGVAEALDGKCSACQMKLRPQRWNDLTGREHEDQIFTCESCGRMLFWDPRRDTPGTWVAGDRWKAALTSGEEQSMSLLHKRAQDHLCRYGRSDRRCTGRAPAAL